MNKIIRLSFVTLLVLTGCQNKVENKTNADIIFSEFLVSDDLQTRAIELYNLSDKEINLNQYKLVIYKGSSDSIIEIKLDGYLDSKKTFTVAYIASDEQITKAADMVSEDLNIDGTWPIALCYKNKQIDVMGDIGYKTKYGVNADLVRKANFLYGRKTFVEFDWIRFKSDNYLNFGNIDNAISEDDYLIGPHLTEEDFVTPFALNSNIGGGGAVKVTLNHTIDGDTTGFNFVEDLSEFGIRNSENIRYNAINTPEIQHGTSINADPWGYAAKDYTNEIISKAKAFAVSTSKNHELRETFGRLMCYVWISYISNPQPRDYLLLNLLIVKEGFSKYNTVINDENEYLKISYSSYLRNAELYAMSSNKHIHGEIDPDFNY